MDQDYAYIFAAKIRVVSKDSTSEIVKRARQFHPRKSSACNDKCEHRLTCFRIALAIGTLEHLDHVIPNTNGVNQALEVEREPLHIAQSQVVRDRS